jgi:hypothetical protein
VPYTPDYRHMLDVLANRRPARLPLYEHIVSPAVMETVLGHSCGNIFEIMNDVIALGSGNSIPAYVPVEGYLAMVRAAQALRAEETAVP